jgi:hypothetical protein
MEFNEDQDEEAFNGETAIGLILFLSVEDR